MKTNPPSRAYLRRRDRIINDIRYAWNAPDDKLSKTHQVLKQRLDRGAIYHLALDAAEALLHDPELHVTLHRTLPPKTDAQP